MTDLMTVAEVGGALAAIGGAAYARHSYPAAYWSTVGLPVSVVRLLASYSSTMDACGLTVEPSRWRALAIRTTTRREVRPVPPRRGLIRPTSTGLRLRLRLARGQEPADVAASAERLRHAWGVHAVYVRDVKPGVVELRPSTALSGMRTWRPTFTYRIRRSSISRRGNRAAQSVPDQGCR